MQRGETKKIRRIRQISVTNLFGIFNHTIPLKMQDRITIIHGPNGFGKTMILKLLHALFGQSNNRLLRDIPFDEFRVDFEDGTSFWVTKSSQLQDVTEEEHLFEQEIIFHCTGKKSFRMKRLRSEDFSLSVSMIDRFIPYLDRINYNVWRNMSTGEILSLDEVLARFGNQLPADFLNERTKGSRTPEWLIEMRVSVSILLIETQRLLSSTQSPGHGDEENTIAVIKDSGQLVNVIRKKQVESGALSQSLDSTFPTRVIKPTAQQSQVAEDELLDKLKKLEEKRSHLKAIGLLDQKKENGAPIDPQQGIEPGTKAVLAVYAEDTEQKLGIYDELAQKIALLTTIINRRFLYKTLTISKEKGFIFTTKSGTILPLENLSSGEQHELVLLYELLFRITPGSLVLIDEPELSLHFVWQEQFLQDVQQVTHLINIDIILATHSVDIINTRRDLVVELEGPENGRL